jgi:hypothetical protein
MVPFFERNADQTFFGVGHGFLDRGLDFFGLSDGRSHVAGAVADDHQGAERKPFTAFHHFGHAVDGDHRFFEVQTVGVYFWHRISYVKS